LRRADPCARSTTDCVKKDHGTEEEARAQQKGVEPLMDGWMDGCRFQYSCWKHEPTHCFFSPSHPEGITVRIRPLEQEETEKKMDRKGQDEKRQCMTREQVL
jgi:hypothetical protein